MVRLYLVADTHIGARAALEDEQSALARRIADDDDALVLGLGDMCECISPSDRRWQASQLMPGSPEHMTNPFYLEALRFAKIWEPTRGKWVGLIPGNHELVARRDYHIDVAAIICDRLGVPYLGADEACGWVRVSMMDNGKSRGAVDIFAIHGWGGGELRGSDALKLQRLLWRKNADLVAVGHLHRGMVFPEQVEYLNSRGYEVARTRWGVIVPPQIGKHAYLASRGGNAPAPGYAVVTISREHSRTPKISVSLELF